MAELAAPAASTMEMNRNHHAAPQVTYDNNTKEEIISFVVNRKRAMVHAGLRDLKHLCIAEFKLQAKELLELSGTPGEVNHSVQFTTVESFNRVDSNVETKMNDDGSFSNTTQQRQVNVNISTLTTVTLVQMEPEKQLIYQFNKRVTTTASDGGSSSYSRTGSRKIVLQDMGKEACVVTLLQKGYLSRRPVLASCCPCASSRQTVGLKKAYQFQQYLQFYDYNSSPYAVASQLAKANNMLRSANPSQTVAPEKFDIFFSHNWGLDSEERNNHERVLRLSQHVANEGVRVWVDEDQMSGNVYSSMAKGIDNSECVAICITRKYMEKVNSGNSKDNCLLEFDYAMDQRGTSILPIVMEEEMADRERWSGHMKLRLGNRLFLSCVGDDGPEKKAKKLVQMIKRL